MHASLIALAVSLSVASAVNRGFNYGAVTRDGAMKDEASFTAEFNAAKGLVNTDGAFSSARLYTMIQSGTTNTPISAIPAAISTNTRLFLGLWASGANVDNEVAALTAAIQQYGEKFTSLVNGISVGSEDLYRISPTGLKNDPKAVGAQPADLVKYIQQVRKAISGTSLSAVPVGHVDTWDVWRNGSNSAVIDEADFLGMNTFPYFQDTEDNSIENAATLFNSAYQITTAAAKGKPVVITETGWPLGGKDSARAHPSIENARSYYQAVGCNTLFGKTETYWYTLVDANMAVDSQPQFGVVGTTLSTKPLFDLTCNAVKSSSSSSASRTATASSSSGIASATGSSGSTSLYPVVNSTTPVSPGSTGGAAAPSGPSGNGPAATPGTPPGATPKPSNVPANAGSQLKASALGFFGAVAALVALA